MAVVKRGRRRGEFGHARRGKIDGNDRTCHSIRIPKAMLDD